MNEIGRPDKEILRKVAKQILDYRRVERQDRRYKSSREYIRNFAGLNQLFDYVRKLSAPTVLEIGGGDTKAIFEISESSLGKDLNFLATVLIKDARIGNYLGLKRTLLTSAESLKGVDKGSCGAVLSFYSCAYSKSPELAVAKIDEALCKGGVFKGVFPTEDSIIGDFEAHGPQNFLDLMKHAGYGTYNVGGVMIAVKSGNDAMAKDLFVKDSLSIREQEDQLPEDQDSWE